MVRRAPPSTVVFQPTVAEGMLAGVSLLTAAIRPTLGPGWRYVMSERPLGGKSPELLNQAGLIARRITELPDRQMDVGAMLLRQVLLEQLDRIGDGGATTAVIFEAAMRAGLAEIAAGTNAQQLHVAVERLLPEVKKNLLALATPVDDPQTLASVALSVCHEPDLAEFLADVVTVVGEDGAIGIRTGHPQELRAEYVDSAYWEGKLLNWSAEADGLGSTIGAERPYVLVSDLAVTTPSELLATLEVVQRAGGRSLIAVVREIADRALALLSANHRPPDFAIIAVRAPGVTAPDRVAALRDLAMLTGARPILEAAGDRLERVRLDDLGRARRAWANRAHFGLIGGQGDPDTVRRELATLRLVLGRTSDRTDRAKLRQRLGRLNGSSAIAWIGPNPTDEGRAELAERTVETLQTAFQDGVVPGGGAALLACAQALCCSGSDAVERAAHRVLFQALRAPIQAIVANAGYEAAPILARLEGAGVGFGFDVRFGRVANMAEAGVLDVGTVVASAVERGISGAVHALTIDVLIQGKRRTAAVSR